jgi:hypothetical protein
MANEDVSHDLSSLLSSEERDFLIRNNGDQVLLLAYGFLWSYAIYFYLSY